VQVKGKGYNLVYPLARGASGRGPHTPLGTQAQSLRRRTVVPAQWCEH
jgi:hypothetical protein